MVAYGTDVFIIDDTFKWLNIFSLHYLGELGYSSLMEGCLSRDMRDS